MGTTQGVHALPVRIPRAATEAPFRTDIQALRAVAVLAVVLNHLSPSWLTGGYVGVDVFFVISGFLITAHLDKEIVRTGRVRFCAFYARRVRRLLPAALLVLGVSVVAAYFLLPYPRWSVISQEAVASATYWENWLLAAKSVDYSAANAQASLAQHYWSLSVEEQFYLVWPLLLCFLRRRSARVLGVALVGSASLAFSVHYTSTTPSEAYFVTPTRAWEFALGALVALSTSRLVLSRAAVGVASFTGFAMIIGSAALYDSHLPFPGYLAVVPTVGTALVIVAGLRPGRQWHTVVTASRPVQLVGDVSYSLYLWHWPLITLAPFMLRAVLPGGHLTQPYLAGVLVASLLLAYLSKMLVEDVGRRITRRVWVTFAAMVVGMALVVTAAETLGWTYGRHVAQAEREQAGYQTVYPELPCHGAPAMDNPCPNRLGPADVTVMGPANEYRFTPPECALGDVNKAEDGTQTVWVCDFSQGDPAAQVVWLVGDSHAQHWQNALFDLAREHRWVLKLGVLGGCPFADVHFVGFDGRPDPGASHRCRDWTPRLADLVASDRPYMVFTSSFARAEKVDDGSGRSQTEQYRPGLERYWREWSAAGARVVVLADTPLNRGVRDENCVVLNPSDPLACAVDRAVAQPPDPLTEVARTTAVPGVTLVDLTRYFCDKRKCYAVVGNVAVYFDQDHMNQEFARSLKPMIAKALGR